MYFTDVTRLDDLLPFSTEQGTQAAQDLWISHGLLQGAAAGGHEFCWNGTRRVDVGVEIERHAVRLPGRQVQRLDVGNRLGPESFEDRPAGGETVRHPRFVAIFMERRSPFAA